MAARLQPSPAIMDAPSMGRMPRTLVVIGKTGSGKSSTCNTLIQTKEFKEGVGSLSETSSCQRREKHVWGRDLSVVDTPGTLDVTDMARAMQELLGAMDRCPDGVDAFLVAFRCDVRATEEECKAAEDALNAFGPECFKRAIVVFTHGDVYGHDKERFGESLSEVRKKIPRFNAIVTKCSDRWVLLDNKEKDKELAVTELLDMVDRVARLNPRRYKKKDQERAQRIKEIEMERQKFIQLWNASMLQERMKQHRQMVMQVTAIQLQAREAEFQMEQQRKMELQQIMTQQRELELHRREMEGYEPDEFSCTLM